MAYQPYLRTNSYPSPGLKTGGCRRFAQKDAGARKWVSTKACQRVVRARSTAGERACLSRSGSNVIVPWSKAATPHGRDQPFAWIKRALFAKFANEAASASFKSVRIGCALPRKGNEPSDGGCEGALGLTVIRPCFAFSE
jgi:hypothetical protein